MRSLFMRTEKCGSFFYVFKGVLWFHSKWIDSRSRQRHSWQLLVPWKSSHFEGCSTQSVAIGEIVLRNGPSRYVAWRFTSQPRALKGSQWHDSQGVVSKFINYIYLYIYIGHWSRNTALSLASFHNIDFSSLARRVSQAMWYDIHEKNQWPAVADFLDRGKGPSSIIRFYRIFNCLLLLVKPYIYIYHDWYRGVLGIRTARYADHDFRRILVTWGSMYSGGVMICIFNTTTTLGDWFSTHAVSLHKHGGEITNQIIDDETHCM